MGCGDEKLSKYLTQTFTAHCNAMICQQVTLSGDAEWPKVADAVIEALFPGIRPGYGLRHALNTLPDKLIGVSASVRKGLRSKFHALLHRCRQRKSLRVVALGHHLRHCADRIATTVGEAHGARVRQWFQAKKAGWYT